VGILDTQVRGLNGGIDKDFQHRLFLDSAIFRKRRKFGPLGRFLDGENKSANPDAQNFSQQIAVPALSKGDHRAQ
jgi:hypothetical protein